MTILAKDKIGFRTWLCSEKKYNERSAGNVISRLDRTITLNSALLESENAAIAIAKLESVSGFSDLSVSVKSQLRRALRLYYEFYGG